MFSSKLVVDRIEGNRPYIASIFFTNGAKVTITCSPLDDSAPRELMSIDIRYGSKEFSYLGYVQGERYHRSHKVYTMNGFTQSKAIKYIDAALKALEAEVNQIVYLSLNTYNTQYLWKLRSDRAEFVIR